MLRAYFSKQSLRSHVDSRAVADVVWLQHSRAAVLWCASGERASGRGTMTTDALRMRSRLHFSQPSQPSQGPTPSHMLSTALGECRLGASQTLEEADVVMSQRSLDAAGCSQLSASQDMGLG